VVEGPLAGGHLGFGMDWAQYDLATIVAEVIQFLKNEHLDIPVIPAGGIFTGSDATAFLESGAAAVQVATRFTVSEECGLPEKVKQEYFKASEDDIEVNQISPTGYPMRMIKSSPGIGDGIRPNCEAYGYLLDANGKCAYVTSYNREVALHPGARKIAVMDKTCLCTHMRNFDIWTCGHLTYRLKDTTRKAADGSYQLLTAEHIFKDYQFSTEQKIALPE
jgi:nitronate monooxygenase